MVDFFDKTSYTEEDIQSLIDNEAEEYTYLEFKESGSLSATEGNKKEISKDVSSFANSSGGVIIYGLSEENNIATSLSFIDGNRFTKEWLEQVIQTNIQRRIDGLQIFPVRFDNDIEQTIYVVKIPESNSIPHMARDRRYYKRQNFQSVRMEEYEVRTLYSRTIKTELNIHDLKVTGSGHSGGTIPNTFREASFDLQVVVKNESNSIEENFKIELFAPSILIHLPAGYPYQEYVTNLGDNTLIKFPNTAPIFQEEIYYFPSIRVSISSRCFASDDNFKVQVRLFYSSGIKYREFNLKNILLIRNEAITEDRFTE